MFCFVLLSVNVGGQSNFLYMSGVKVMFRLTFVFQLNYPSAFTEFTLQPTPESLTAHPQTHKARKPTTSDISDLFTSLRRRHWIQSPFCLCLSPPCCQRQVWLSLSSLFFLSALSGTDQIRHFWGLVFGCWEKRRENGRNWDLVFWSRVERGFHFFTSF
jgi:hypothetical protein